ncbi:MAG: glucose-6-phosphate dehydrogenase assembly protein OpcA [Propionibacteriaceae bacterium]
MATTTLTGTTSSAIAAALLEARRKAGSPAMGMVLTLIVVSDEKGLAAALAAALEAGHEHPSRVIVVVTGPGRKSSLDAEVRVGDGNPGEAVILRMRGPVSAHSASVVRPLLLPDSPVVVFWPGTSPLKPAEDDLGKMANRRITDSMGTGRPLFILNTRAASYAPGDTDLTWTRLTPWRSLLAAAIDQYPKRVLSVVVEAERNNASANLLAAWLQCRLGVDVRRLSSEGPGITAVRMRTAAGDIALTRPDGLIASYSVPGQPNRIVALKRRRVAELIAEELRRMDPDDIFAQALTALQANKGHPSSGSTTTRMAEPAPALRAPAKKAAAKKTSAKKAPAKKTAAKKTPAKKTAAKKVVQHG